jgi:hypothetical protein
VCRGLGETNGTLYLKGNKNHQLVTGFFVFHTIVSATKGEEFVSYWMSYIVLRGRWCNIVVLNVHAQSGEKSMIQKAVSMRK